MRESLQSSVVRFIYSRCKVFPKSRTLLITSCGPKKVRSAWPPPQQRATPRQPVPTHPNPTILYLPARKTPLCPAPCNSHLHPPSPPSPSFPPPTGELDGVGEQLDGLCGVGRGRAGWDVACSMFFYAVSVGSRGKCYLDGRSGGDRLLIGRVVTPPPRWPPLPPLAAHL